jgi:hypothetical protein
MQSDAALNICVALALHIMGPHCHSPVGIGVPE